MRLNLVKAHVVLCSLMFLTIPWANAADQQDKKGNIDLGGFLFTPSLDIEQRYDDNLLRESGDKLDSWGTLVTPTFVLRNNYGINDMLLGYSLKRGNYYSSDADNFTDHRLWTQLGYQLNTRHRLMLDAEYLDGHDARGTRYSIGHGDELLEPDQFKDTDMELTYRYGGETATGKIDLRYRYKGVNYDGNSVDYLERDRDTHILGSTFYYQVAPNTDLLFDISTAEINYDFALEERNRLDSTEQKALIGVRWESTEATTGFAKIGMRRKDFDSDQRENYDGFDWEVGVLWQPVNYSQFEISTMSDIKETDGQGNFIEKRDYQLSWQYDWTGRFNSELELLYQDDTYATNALIVDEVAVDREDRNWGSKLAANYQFRRWLLFSIAYRYDQRNSNLNNLDFDRNLFSISLQASL
ncbi:outer membrane beta-barrel protein [Neptunicella sp. SCSIO 80796]|uniref:outer membrane beta-barrel protein n=1 Tax=Neptunicella plasticusilytica TaxID=3117012 RepID=UPI003A4D781A